MQTTAQIDIQELHEQLKAVIHTLYYAIYEDLPGENYQIIEDLQEKIGLDFYNLLYDVLCILNPSYYKTLTVYDIMDIISSADFKLKLTEPANELLMHQIANNPEIVKLIVRALHIIDDDEYVLITYDEDDIDSDINSEAAKIANSTVLSGAYRFVLHRQDAKKAGTHYDIRIEVKKDYVYSIAFRYNPFEKDKAMGIVQPIHTSEWLTFEGEIKEGYGAGKLKIIAKGICKFFVSDKDHIILQFKDTMNARILQYAVIVDTKEPNKLLFVKTEKEFSEHPKFRQVDMILKPKRVKKKIDL